MLVTMKEILDRAQKEGYGVTAPNVQSEDTVRAVIHVAEELNAPMIIDVNAFIHPDLPWFVHMIRDLVRTSPVPFAINLDHGKSYEDIMLGINSGFTSIMALSPTAQSISVTSAIVCIMPMLPIILALWPFILTVLRLYFSTR